MRNQWLHFLKYDVWTSIKAESNFDANAAIDAFTREHPEWLRYESRIRDLLARLPADPEHSLTELMEVSFEVADQEARPWRGTVWGH
jgi:hypothetical protein